MEVDGGELLGLVVGIQAIKHLTLVFGPPLLGDARSERNARIS